MKKLLIIAAASLLSFGANAADYTLDQIISANPFAPAGTDLCPGSLEDGIACGGSATVDDVTGDIVVTGVQYAFASVNADFLYQGGTWNTALGADSVIKAGQGESCTATPTGNGSGCGNDFLGDWISGTGFQVIDEFGAVVDYGGTDSITVSILGDGRLSIRRISPFPIPTLTQRNEYIFAQIVPVPAAVWLFGSALGLLGWARRRAA